MYSADLTPLNVGSNVHHILDAAHEILDKWRWRQHLVVALEKVVEVVPLADWAASRVQSVPTALLEVALTPADKLAHALHVPLSQVMGILEHSNTGCDSTCCECNRWHHSVKASLYSCSLQPCSGT